MTPEQFKAHRNKQGQARRDANGWLVYYIPSTNYCGITNDPPRRKSWHKHMGTDVEGFRVIYHSESKVEAAYHEALFQAVLGMNGINVKGIK